MILNKKFNGQVN